MAGVMDNPFGTKQVGEFPEQRNVRMAYRNPLDVATIVSVFPVDFVSVKETLFSDRGPGNWLIHGGSAKSPTITHIGVASWWRQVQGGQPDQEVPVSSVQIAESIINDYCSKLVECEGEKKPGLFYVPGEKTLDDITNNYKKALEEAIAKQKKWFLALIDRADSDWSKNNNNPISVWQISKLAAIEMGMLDKPWMKNLVQSEKIKCFACGNLRDPEYPICGVCKVIDPNHPKGKDLMFAK